MVTLARMRRPKLMVEAYAIVIDPTIAKINMATRAPVTIIRRVRGFTHTNVAAHYAGAMGTLRLHALNIDEVRDLFQGKPEVADLVRRLVASSYPPVTTPSARGLLAKLGPLMRRAADAPVVLPGVPTPAEIEMVVHGHYVPPERLSAAWAVAELWLTDRAWSSVSISIDEATGDDLDFELAAAGVPPSASLRSLFGRSLRLPLQPPPGQASGYLRGTRVDAFRAAWLAALPGVYGPNAATAQQVVTWLGGLEDWRSRAVSAGRPQPDVIALFAR